jgi:hypothetical protein
MVRERDLRFERRLHEHARLACATAAELNEFDRTAGGGDHLRREAFQDFAFGPR